MSCLKPTKTCWPFGKYPENPTGVKFSMMVPSERLNVPANSDEVSTLALMLALAEWTKVPTPSRTERRSLIHTEGCYCFLENIYPRLLKHPRI